MSEIKRRPEYIPPVPEVIGVPAPTPTITPDVPTPPQVDPGNDWGDLQGPPDSPEIPDPLAVNPQRPVLPKAEEAGERTGEHGKPQDFYLHHVEACVIIEAWRDLCHVARRPRHDASGQMLMRRAYEQIQRWHERLKGMDVMTHREDQADAWDKYIKLCWIAGIRRDDSVMPEMYRREIREDS